MPILSLVVMANPKTIIKKVKCPAEIEKTLIKYDQIKVTLEKYQNDKANQYDLSEDNMYDIANLLIKLNTPIDMNFEAKYQLPSEVVPGQISRKDELQLREELTAYRLLTSREEQVKAYFLFNNAEMEDMIAKYPRTEAELLEMKGFGKVKVEKYGHAILNIFNE
jgi:superfamily II DNA helicase RecQ